ncbi:hypothetical protein [Pseudoteredinibacter isoporae]|uniref:hypothetical protein n=1 Tax=Pseudoteredinibacter isoporae TaxID=570281 RepID=UPI00310538B8
MTRLLLGFILLPLLACSAAPAKHSLKVDTFGDGQTQEVFYKNISRKDAIALLNHYTKEQQLNIKPSNELELSNLSGAEVSRSLTLDDLYFVIAFERRVRAYVRECWGSKCRFVFATSNEKRCGVEPIAIK